MELLRNYLDWVKTSLERTWDGDPAYIAENGDLGGIVKFFGAIAGGITGLIIYFSNRSESDAVLPILVIISGLIGGSLGVAAAIFAAAAFIVAFRIALSLLILFGPPTLAYLAIRIAIAIVVFLFTPI